MLQEIAKYWPFVSSAAGMLAGGLITWTTARIKLEDLLKRVTAVEVKMAALEKSIDNDKVAMADRLARVEVKLDDVRAAILRLENR